MPKSKKTQPPAAADPHAAREAGNYENPVASREYILQTLEELGQPASLGLLCKQLGAKNAEEQEGIRRRLRAMNRDGQIIANRRGDYGLASHMNLIKGRVQGHRDGFGFFIRDDGEDDLFLNAREMERLFDGDRVLARSDGVDDRGRGQATVVEILERRFTEIVGRYYSERGFGVLVPDSKRVAHEILIPDAERGGAEDGQYVVGEITEYPERRRKAIGRIKEVLGDTGTPGIEIDMALRSHEIPHQFSAAASKQANKLRAEVEGADKAGRFDLRDLPLVTIDGEDAKDFDDAVFAEKRKGGGWTLYVAIADVSHYVAVDSPLDEDAKERATSVYFPGFVVPMLPEKLSNGLCSLKPEVDRLAMVCKLSIDVLGEVVDYEFMEALIHSHGRLTYNEVADMLMEPDNETRAKLQQKLRKRHEALFPHLQNLYELYHALREKRENSGAMDFESTETRIVFGENKKIREIVPVERNDAHRLIEECMLVANVAAATLLSERQVPVLYRVHEGPNVDKLQNLRDFLSTIGLQLAGGDKPLPQHYQRVLQSLADRPDRHLLQTMLIRSMMQAVYQPENVGHFGLGFDAYTHFTSPIRRYPDLLVHRAIRSLLRDKRAAAGKHLNPHPDAKPLAKSAIYPYGMAEMIAFGENCSTAERRADAASYSVMDWLKCEYMLDHVGAEFTGTVASVTSFGLFVELNDIYIEGLIHISELDSDYYHFDAGRHCLQGERSGRRYQLGDVMQVKVARVDLDEKKIDLQPVGQPASKRGSLRDALKRGEVPGKSGGQGANKSGRSGRGSGKSRSAAARGAGASKSGAGKPAAKKKKSTTPKHKKKAAGTGGASGAAKKPAASRKRRR